MTHTIFKNLAHQKIIKKVDNTNEVFHLYSCGIFNNGTKEENIEFVELTPKSEYKKHYHKQSSAVIYMLYGTGLFYLDNETISYKPEMRINIPRGVLHGFKTDTATLFLSIQSPPIINNETQDIDLFYT